MGVKNVYFFLSIFIIFYSCKTDTPTTKMREDWKKYYQPYGVEGSFVFFDETKNEYSVYNKELINTPLSPASTYKIFNSMVGLQTGAIPDENYVIEWDSVVRNPVWDMDHDLKTAFKNSTVWYYQELARRVGGKKMKYWLDTCHYGNADTTGGIDHFWLEGGLRISPMEQVRFLQRFNHNQLPFNERSVDITKKMMIVKDSAGVTIRAKSGWGMQDGYDIGWYVGYAQKDKKNYYFCNCIRFKGKTMGDEQAILFDRCRRDVTYKILEEMELN